MTKWKIVRIEHNPFDNDHSPTDQQAYYCWELSQEGSSWKTGSGFNYADVMQLMKHFKVQTAAELVGLTFESEKNEASSALDFLLVQIRHGGSYTPPSGQIVRNRVLASLANLEQPDLSDLDGETIANAFREVWGDWEADETWLSKLMDDICYFSTGQVHLRKADSNTFSVHIKGPASYLELVKGGTVQKIIIGPYSTPVSFVKQ